MTDYPYPNREHQRADERARRRAKTALESIETTAGYLIAKLENGYRLDADDTEGLSDLLRKLTGHLAEIGTLYDVREWHAADLADASQDEVDVSLHERRRAQRMQDPEYRAAYERASRDLTGYEKRYHDMEDI